MLSVATATVHRSMRAKAPTPSSSPDNLLVDTSLTWNAELAQSPKRRRSHQGPCSARKKLIPSPAEDTPLKINLNSAEITLTPIKKCINRNDSIDRSNLQDRNVEDTKSNNMVISNEIDENEHNDVSLLLEVHNNSKSIAKNVENENCKTKPENCSLIHFVNSDEISIRPIVKSVVNKKHEEELVSQSELTITESRNQEALTDTSKPITDVIMLRGTPISSTAPSLKNMKHVKIILNDLQNTVASNAKTSQNYILRSQISKATDRTVPKCLNNDTCVNDSSDSGKSAIPTMNFYNKSLKPRNSIAKSSLTPKKSTFQNMGSDEIKMEKSPIPTKKILGDSLSAKITRAVEVLAKNCSKNSINITPSAIDKSTKPKNDHSNSGVKVSVLTNPIVPNLENICTAQNNMETMEIPPEMPVNWNSIKNSADVTVPSNTQTIATETLDDVLMLSDIDLQEPYHMTGFPNPPGENRCWLNATLQALFALPLFDTFQQFDIENCSNLTKLLNATKMYWMNGVSGRDKAYQTVKLLKLELGTLDETYPSECQQDVSEFLMILLNHIKLDLSKIIIAEEEAGEAENVPKNQQDAQNRVLKLPQTPNKRQPLADISTPQYNSLTRTYSLGDSSQSPKFRKQMLTHSVEDLLSPKVRKLSAPSDPAYKVHTPPRPPVNDEDTSSKNPVEENFQLYLMEHYTCKGCEKQRQKKVDNLMLFVDIPSDDSVSPIDLQKAVEHIFAPEERHLTCGTCKHDVHTMRTVFRRRPNILTLQVNRYGMSSEGIFAKISTDVEIPKRLNLSATFSSDLSRDTGIYEPICIIAHAGATMDCGHYTSYVRHKDQWYHYNDMSVTPMTTEEALSAAQMTAYLIFFVKSTSSVQDSG